MNDENFIRNQGTSRANLVKRAILVNRACSRRTNRPLMLAFGMLFCFFFKTKGLFFVLEDAFPFVLTSTMAWPVIVSKAAIRELTVNLFLRSRILFSRSC